MTTLLFDRLQAMTEADDTKYECCLSIAEVREIIKALEPHHWQPIDTAPKDGTPVILAVTGGMNGPVIGEARWWNDGGGDWWWANTMPSNYHHGPVREINFGEPTHWMAMPIEPKVAV